MTQELRLMVVVLITIICCITFWKVASKINEGGGPKLTPEEAFEVVKCELNEECD